MREIIESVRRKQQLQVNEARVDHTTAGKDISSIATMMSTTMKALKHDKITILIARKRIEAIMNQYLFTMKDATWDSLRDEFANSDDYKNTAFAKYLVKEWQTVPKPISNDVIKLAKEWAMEINRGGHDFGIMIALKPGMRRLKPKDETIKAYDDAANATDPDVPTAGTGNAEPEIPKGTTFKMPMGSAGIPVTFRVIKKTTPFSDGKTYYELEFIDQFGGKRVVSKPYDEIKQYLNPTTPPAPKVPTGGTEDELKDIYKRNAAKIAARFTELIYNHPDIQNIVLQSMDSDERQKYTILGKMFNGLGLDVHQRLVDTVKETVTKDVEAILNSKKW